MAITVANGPVKLIFRSCRKEENDFVLGLEMKPMKYADMTMPTAEDKKNQVLMNHSKGSKNFYVKAYKK